MEPKPAGKLSLKTNFDIKHKWEPFYTGGSIVPCDDGKTLLCSCGDTVQVIDVETGSINCSLSQDGDDITCLLSSPDNGIVVSAMRSLLLKQWKIDGKTFECVRTWKAIHTSPIMCMDFDATSTLLATGGSDSTIKIWDMVHQYCTHNLRGSQGVISTVKFHPCDLKLFSASNDYAIRIWDLQTSRCICMLKGHVSAVTSLSFDLTSNNVLVSGGRDSVLCVWDLQKTKQKNEVEPTKTIPAYETLEKILVLPHEDASKLLEFVKDEVVFVLTAGNSGILKVWNCRTGKCVYSQKAEEEENKSMQRAITELLYLKNGKYAAVTFDHNISIFDIDKEFRECKHLVGYNDEVLDVRFLGQYDSHIVVATNSPLVKVFDRKSSSCQLLSGHQDTVLCLAVFKDKLTFISGSKDNSVRVWKMDKATSDVSCLFVARSHTHAVTTLACPSLKSNFLVSGSQDLTLKIWKILHTSDEQGNPATSLKVKHAIKAHDKDINSVTISPNDKLVATGSQDKTAKLWDALDGSHLGSFHGHKRGIWSCQFSPTDQVLGSSSADGTIKLWSLSDFACLKTFEGHDCSVLKMIFISKGTQLMTSGSNGLMKLWNIKSSECVKTLEGHDDKVWGLAINSDDSIVLSGAADSKIIQWEDVTEKERQEAKQEEDTVVLRQQELNNLIHEKRFAKAFKLAITLDQPFTALKVLKEMRWEEDGDETVKSTISKLRADQKDTLLKFVMSWNTNSRNCHEAQKVLNYILKLTHPDELMKYSNTQAAVEALIPYTERHYQRMSRLIMNTTFVDYVWQMMKLKPLSLTSFEKEKEASAGTAAAFDKSLRETSGLKRHPLKMYHGDIANQRPPKRIRKPDGDDENNTLNNEEQTMGENEEKRLKEGTISTELVSRKDNSHEKEKKLPRKPSEMPLKSLKVLCDRSELPPEDASRIAKLNIDEAENNISPPKKMRLRSATKGDRKSLCKKK